MKNHLIGSAGSLEELKKAIAEYWLCGEEDIFLSELGHIKKKGIVMGNFSWRKLKGRYRFEALT